MSQANETASNAQLSPRSSCGGGESCKQEGTPDTRLTAFSPDDGATKVTKSAVVKGTDSKNATPEPHVKSQALSAATFAATPVVEEKDPFVSTTKPEQKLSPTASTFMPIAPITPIAPMMVHPAMNTPMVIDYRQQVGIQYATRFSSELGISHHMVISTISGAALTSGELEDYLAVSLPFRHVFRRSSL